MTSPEDGRLRPKLLLPQVFRATQEVHFTADHHTNMGTASRNSSTTRSRSPCEQKGGLSQNIPEIFRTQLSNMAASCHGQSQAAALALTGIQLSHTTMVMRENSDHPQQHPSFQDLHTIAADIKDTLSGAISDLRLDIHAIADRVH